MALSDYVFQFSGYIAHSSQGENWRFRIYYRGSLSLFKNYNDRNYHYHRMGTVWSQDISKTGSLLNLGINGSLRKNKMLYNYYDFKDVSGYANIKIKFGPSISTVVGYKIRGRWYSNLPELEYKEHFFFARYTHFFQTQTSIILEGNYGRKIYLEQIVGTTSEYWNSQWNMNWEENNHHSEGWGMGGMSMGSWASGTSQVVSKPISAQLVGKIRIAQSLGKTTGLSAEFLLRRNSENIARYLPGQVSSYITEDELYDDRYGYESEEIEIMITQYLPWEFAFKSTTGYRWKDYSRRPALDLDGNTLPDQTLRVDEQMLLWINLSKPFTLFTGRDANIYLDFFWVKNQSNDFFYNYKVGLISMGFGLSF
jgi:hypothetical protein